LDLQYCDIVDLPAAAAAIAALQQLQNLKLVHVETSASDAAVLSELQLPSQLTQLCLQQVTFTSAEAAKLSQLSGLVNLAHVKLTRLPDCALPGGLPSQLVKLTCLEVAYHHTCDIAEQFRHLSSLTALQQLSVDSSTLITGHLSGMKNLSQLTGLQLEAPALNFSTTSTQSWACMTALQSLTLKDCKLQPAALSKLTQLKALSLLSVRSLAGASLDQLLTALSQVTLLMELSFQPNTLAESWAPFPTAAAAFTALTASTHLCSLQLGLWKDDEIPADYVVLGPAAVYPHMREVNWHDSMQVESEALPMSDQQLQQLCCCCPAVESLLFAVPAEASSSVDSAFLPLLQLSGLTRLQVSEVGEAAAALMRVIAQLTGLKELVFGGFPVAAGPTLLQLTALTALEGLTIGDGVDERQSMWNMVRLLRIACCAGPVSRLNPPAAS
jgi:hypothetical protein